MLRRIILLSIIFVLITSNCHYSCQKCTGKSYASCLNLQNPANMPRQFWSSLYPTGICIQTFSSQSNGFGVFLFLFLTVICLIIRTKQSFYLYFTIQTLGLFNLIQIGWVNPIGYLLQSMQYLMIWNVVGSGYKKPDYILISSKNYRLNRFFHQSQIGQNIALIAVFTIIPLILLILICIISIRRKKQKQEEKALKKSQNQVIYQNILNQSQMDRDKDQLSKKDKAEQRCACWKAFTQDVLVQIAKFLIVFMYYMIQQTIVVLLVSLVFLKPVKANIIILCIVYLHILVFIMSYGYYYRIQYFKQKKTMYINYAKKIILPVMVVIPISNQYLIFLFALILLFIEFIIDYTNDLYQKFNRLVFYKILQIIIIFLLCIYYIVEVNSNSFGASRAAAIACTLFIALYLACFVLVQLPLGIKQKYFDTKNNAVDDNKENLNRQQITLQQIKNNSNDDQQNKQKHLSIMNNEGDSLSKNRTSNIRDKESLNRKNDNDNGNKNDIQIQELEDIDDAQVDQRQNNKQDNQSINYNNSVTTKNKNQGQEDKQEITPQIPLKKKKRKQIIDKQLRLRYGI